MGVTIKSEGQGRIPPAGSITPPGIQTSGSILKRNVNVFLLIVVILIVSIGVGYTVTYQKELRGISSTFQNTTDNLSRCTATLTATRQNLAVALSKINETEKDVKTYDTIYEKKNTELESAQDQLASTSQELDKTKAKLARNEQLLTDTSGKLQDITVKYNAVVNQVSILNQKVSALQSQVDCLESAAGSAGDSC